jgi:hypothetical protein
MVKKEEQYVAGSKIAVQDARLYEMLHALADLQLHSYVCVCVCVCACVCMSVLSAFLQRKIPTPLRFCMHCRLVISVIVLACS